MIVVHRFAVAVLLTGAATLPAAAQNPGANAKHLPPHVAEHLWPERELTATEQELKDRVQVMRDSLTRVHATVSLLQRQQRSQAGAGILRSTARALAADCARSGRVAESMAAFAADFATNDAKWGEPTVRAYRASLADMVGAMRRCTEAVTAEVDDPDVTRLRAAADAADESVRRYDRAEWDLFRTLKIRLDPREKARSSRR